jgi:hypothetical protein
MFKIKSDEHGHITRYRARLVAKGFLQREGVDYGDIFSPVVRYSTLRILLALAAHYGMFKRHLDCPKAFRQADLDTPCYMKPPPGMKVPSGFCLELVKSIKTTTPNLTSNASQDKSRAQRKGEGSVSSSISKRRGECQFFPYC